MAKQKKEQHKAGKGKSNKAQDACLPNEKEQKSETPRQSRSVGIGIPMSQKEMAEIKKRSEKLDE